MSTENKIKIGVVGLGRFVEIAHMPTYFNSRYASKIDVAAICDVSQERLTEWQQKYNIPAGYTDVDAMLAKEKLDVVVVVTPDHLHTGIVCKALEAGCDVLVEKPLATDIKECHQIIQAAKKTGRRVITDFHKREDPAHQEARYRIVEEKRYGQVQFGYAWMQDTINVPAPGFFKSNFAEKSSPIWFLGVHFFDILRYITDLEPMQIRATGYKQVLAGMGINTFDSIKSDIVFNNGASISFMLSWNLPEGAPNFTTQGLYLQFENGELEVDTRDRGMYELSKHGYKTVNPMFTRHTSQGMAGYGHESIGDALMELLELKNSNRSKLQELYAANPSDRNGFYATLMAQATHASLDRGQKSAKGDVFLGKIIDVNEYIKECLGNDASDYLVNADIK
jgi:predicted dehydrogenase